MRGQIKSFGDADKSGEIVGEDGQHYRFSLEDLLHENSLRYHANVLFEVNEGRAVAVDVLGDDGFSIGGGPEVIEDNLSMWNFFKRAMTRKYFDFSGRARRKEYWSFVLFYLLNIMLVFGAGFALLKSLNMEHQAFSMGGITFNGMIVLVVFVNFFAFLFFIPALAISVRRLHDIGLSGWLVLISFVPLLGPIALFVMMLWPTSEGRNEYGPAPLHRKNNVEEESFDL